MLRNAIFIHTLNQAEDDFIRKLRICGRTEVIPNGIFEEQFANIPPQGTFQSDHPELHNSPYILFLSRLHYQKGVSLLAQAFALLSQTNQRIHLVVAGPDYGSKSELEDYIATAGLSQRVHLVGPLYGSHKLAAFRDAACFCLPSLNERFSMAILEALACGLPAVISENCFFKEVETCGAGLVLPLSAERFSKGLSHVLDDSEELERMRNSARSLVLSTYTWPAIAAKSIDAYTRHRSTGGPRNGSDRA